jgi:uncharacterized protein (TIGR03084 family)
VVDLAGLLGELDAEGTSLEVLVSGLPDGAFAAPTPAPGWSISCQLAHLAWTDEIAALAAREPDAFRARAAQAASDPSGFVDDAAIEGARVAPADLLARWRDSRAQLRDALEAVPDGHKLPWFGPPMSAASMATARMMETWAHGQDVADALGVTRAPTARLRHVARIGVRTRDFAFTINGLPLPEEDFRVELTGPDGEPWEFGPQDAPQRVSGTALDFCLLVTQRRHRDDLGVRAVGSDADTWLTIAQAFAGPPGTGRTAGEFA